MKPNAFYHDIGAEIYRVACIGSGWVDWEPAVYWFIRKPVKP
jgi:hypothetical protein